MATITAREAGTGKECCGIDVTESKFMCPMSEAKHTETSEFGAEKG